MPKKTPAAKPIDRIEDAPQNLHGANFEAEAQTDLELIARRGQSLDISLPESVPQLKRWLIEQETVSVMARAQRGFGYLALKHQLGHGEFMAWVEDTGISYSRVNRAMRLADVLMRVNEEQTKKLVSLPASSLLPLAKLDDEDLQALVDSEDFDDYAQMSRIEAVRHIKQLEARKANVDEQNAELRAQNAELRDALHNKAAVDHLPAFCLITRHEAAALSEQIIGAVESMEDVYERHLAAASLEGEDAERYRDVALNSVYHAMAAAAARCYSLTDRLRRQWGDRIGGMDELLPFTEDEVERLLAARRVLVSEHQQQAEGRKETRAKQQPKRRGRPRKRLQGDD